MDKSEHATLALCLLKMAVVSGFDNNTQQSTQVWTQKHDSKQFRG